jgi:hypothetical protein
MNLWPSSSSALAASIAIACFAGIVDAEMPSGWVVAGSDPKNYEIGLDQNVSYTGRSSAYIKEVQSSKGFATLMQSFRADLYRGKRVRLSAYVKSVDIQRWAGLWMRVDGQPQGSSRPVSLSFDNMGNRPIKGTTEWARYEIVLNVPVEAVAIFFGALLEGHGTLWSDNFEFGVVDASVPITGDNSGEGISRRLPKQPVNLDFEER